MVRAWLSFPPEWLRATRAPRRIISRHRGGTGISAIWVDMDRSPRWRCGDRSPAPDSPEGRRPPPPVVARPDGGGGAEPAAKATNGGARPSSRWPCVRNCTLLPACGIDCLEREGAAMPPEELVQACLDEMRDSDEIAIAGEVAEANRVALLGTEGVAAVLAGYAIGVLPEELRATFAYEVACREETVCGRIVMYWLLDDTAEVRLGAAEGFRERAQREIVEPVSAALVPLIRNWMPAAAGRTLLDEALAEARRRELVAPLPRPERAGRRSSGRSPTSGAPRCCTRFCKAETSRPS